MEGLPRDAGEHGWRRADAVEYLVIAAHALKDIPQHRLCAAITLMWYFLYNCYVSVGLPNRI